MIMGADGVCDGAAVLGHQERVPTETIEAARIDGANEVQIFWRVVGAPDRVDHRRGADNDHHPGVLKVFDIVLRVDRTETSIRMSIANRFIIELFDLPSDSDGPAAIVVPR